MSAQWSACASALGKTAAISIFKYRYSATANQPTDTTSGNSAPVHAVIPWYPQRPRTHAHDNPIAFMKTVKVVHVDRKPLDPLPWPPRTHYQPPAPFHDPFHIEAAHHHRRVINNVLLRIQPPINEKRR